MRFRSDSPDPRLLAEEARGTVRLQLVTRDARDSRDSNTRRVEESFALWAALPGGDLPRRRRARPGTQH